MNILEKKDYSARLIESKLQLKGLWYEGNLDLLGTPSVAVIGTREPTQLGLLRVEKTCKILAERGFTIVSGLASGVDTAAHEAAFKYSGKTIAVLPTPIDKCYPKENSKLKDRIAESGLLLSQFETGSQVYKSNFITRNKLMAAISSMTIVVEASVKSGTRHQVEACLKMNRPIGFLASLVEKKYPWVLKALEADGLGFTINGNDKFDQMLQSISQDYNGLPSESSLK